MVSNEEQFNRKLREIMHGVKNHLQVLNSLFELQSMDAADASSAAAFRESLGRLRVLTTIYKNLSSEDSYRSVDFEKVVTEILDQMLSSLSKFEHMIVTAVQLENLILDLDTALPFGLIMNELFMYSLANIQNGDKRQISIQLLEHDHEYALLEYTDTGMNLPGDFTWNSPKQSLGMRMISGLSRQIGGRAEVSFEPVRSFKVYVNKKSIIKKLVSA